MRPRKYPLPPNLYYNKTTGHHRYVRPDTGESCPFGKDRAKAVRAAKTLNDQLMPEQDLVVQVLKPTPRKPQNTLSEHITWMHHLWETKVADDELSPATRDFYISRSKRIDKALGHKVVADLEVLDLAAFLETVKGYTAHNHYRGILRQMLNHAIGRGLIKNRVNPADYTFKKKLKVRRKRLTLDEYNVIWKHASPVLQNAMDLALLSLQRVGDIVTMLKEDVVTEKGKQYIRVNQGKTKKVFIEIEAGPSLDAVIDRCCKDNIVSKYLIHWPIMPGRRALTGKPLSVSNIDKHFAAARAKAIAIDGIFQGYDPDQYPSFHELRPTGAFLLANIGLWPQALLGHTTRQMTEKYLERHEIVWKKVKAELPLIH